MELKLECFFEREVSHPLGFGQKEREDTVGYIRMRGVDIYRCNCYDMPPYGYNAVTHLLESFARDIQPEEETRLA